MADDDPERLVRTRAAEFLGLGGLAGDFNGDGLLDVADINRLSAESAAGNHRAEFDLDNDGFVNASDISVWVRDLKQTWLGDANLDGEFNSTDLVVVFAAGFGVGSAPVAGSQALGKVIRKVVPCPTWLSTGRAPEWDLTIL